MNLIGEHTDYNDGFVMPLALDRSTWVAAAPRNDRTIVARSRELDEETLIDLDAPPAGPTGHWSDYVRGVAFLAHAPGADMLIASDVPLGAGVSSSAALEVACAGALLELAGAAWEPTAVAKLCQQAEHQFAGTHCGIMDQMIACVARAGTAMWLDTRSLARTFVPIPDRARVLVCNTMVRHALASGEYNRRRADCEAGVAALSRVFPSIRALRDATLEQLDAVKAEVPARVVARCRHVITENDRVERAAEALTHGDLAACGRLMAASHASLRDDYEVSCVELDVMVEIAADRPGVFGARMTGGGFGGSAVALVDAEHATHDLLDAIRERYESRTNIRPDVWATSAGSGASAWSAAGA